MNTTLKFDVLSVIRLFAFLCASALSAQDTMYFDHNYKALRTSAGAEFMEIRRCAAEDPNKCSMAVVLLEKNQIICNVRFIDFANLILHGKCHRWYYDGALMMEIPYDNGQKQGVEKLFYPNGQLQRQLTWDHDTIVSGAFFNEDGSPKQMVYQDDLDQVVFQVSPSFPGGEKAMFAYLFKTIDYPEEARENNIQGKVLISFVVEKNGNITEVKEILSTNPLLTKALVDAVKKMPPWLPGRLDGRPVKVRYQLPFNFRLE